MDKIDGSALTANNMRDGDTVMTMTYDQNVATLLSQVVTALARISLRLDAGIKTQALGVGVTVPATV